jgi:hypothetical protein
MKKFIIYPMGLLFIFLTACEDMFIKKIDVNEADSPVKLSVTATLDVDSGRLSLSIREGYSLQHFHTYQKINQSIVHNGTIRLFENGSEIFTKAGTFDLSTGNAGNGYYATFTGVSAVAGYTYRLLIDIEGYPVATASAVMPEAPIVYDVTLDTKHVLERNNVLEITPLVDHYSTGQFEGNPFVLHLADNSVEKDYYSLQIESYQISESKHTWGQEFHHQDFFSTIIATPDLTLVQDNPDIESKDLTSEGEGYDMYGFWMMVFTDATFSNSDKRLNLYASTNRTIDDNIFYYPKSVTHYDPWVHGVQTHIIKRQELLVTHLSPETFRQYRSMAFQNAGLGFFTEPVFITSNMENAYGCFSVQHTIRVPMIAFEGWSYSGRVTDMDFIEDKNKGK